MTFTRTIGLACNKVILFIVRMLALSKIHPNVLTFIGLLINAAAAMLIRSPINVRTLGWILDRASILTMNRITLLQARPMVRVKVMLGTGFLEALVDRD